MTRQENLRRNVSALNLNKDIFESSLLQKSIREGALHPTWYCDFSYRTNRLVRCTDNLLRMQRFTVMTEFHGVTQYVNNIPSNFCFDAFNGKRILKEESVSAWFVQPDSRMNRIKTHYTNTYMTPDGERILQRDLSKMIDNAYAHRTLNADVILNSEAVWLESESRYERHSICYQWSNGDWYTEPQPTKLYDYHTGPRHSVTNDPTDISAHMGFTIGFEIEKSEMPDFEFSKEDVVLTHLATLERDGSVEKGFELITPTFNLFSSKTDERLRGLEDFINIKGIDNAGGHIGYGIAGYRDRQILDKLAGWVPLIFSMYSHRMGNSYCDPKKISRLKESGDKMQAITMKGSFIEFRIVSAVPNLKTLIWRLNFFRIMSRYLDKPFLEVMAMVIDPQSAIGKHLRSNIYSDPAKFVRLIQDAVAYDKQFSDNPLSLVYSTMLTSVVAKDLKKSKAGVVKELIEA